MESEARGGSGYKHLNGLPAGNVLLIGNSGTGKTTIMRWFRRFYAERPELEKFRVMIIINANMLAGEEAGEVSLQILFNNLENEARRILEPGTAAEEVRELVWNNWGQTESAGQSRQRKIIGV